MSEPGFERRAAWLWPLWGPSLHSRAYAHCGTAGLRLQLLLLPYLLTECQLPSGHLGRWDLEPGEGKGPAQHHDNSNWRSRVGPGTQVARTLPIRPAVRRRVTACASPTVKDPLAAHKSDWTPLVLFTRLADWASPYQSPRVIYWEAWKVPKP